jgi:hypothetical protein
VIRYTRNPSILPQRLIHRIQLLLLLLSLTAAFAAETPDPAGEAIREKVPLGGDFAPNPKVPAFVVVGHGGRIIVSKDDGKSWTQTFFGVPGADHGAWATKTATYGDGVFVVGIGWGGPTNRLASEDGVNWRHLTKGETELPESKGNPRIMPGT